MPTPRSTKPWARPSTPCTVWQSMLEVQEVRSQESEVRSCIARDLGRIGYAEAFELQRTLVDQRKRGEICDQLLIVEHPHVVTMGRNGHDENVLASPELLERAGIQFHRTD